MSTGTPHPPHTARSRLRAVLAALAGTALLVVAGGCGDSAESDVGVRELGWKLRPLPAVNVAEEFRALGQGSDSFGSQVEQILEAEGVEGVWVIAVGGGAAERAGIDAGDVITEVAGEAVENVGEVRSALRSVERGATVEVEGLFVASGDPTDFLDAWSAEVEIPAR